MAQMLDLDQLRTFVAIAETGSFTKAADVVFKTQSAVSMQMRRLEERIGKPIFVRDGRASRLTEEGERLLGYARRMVRLSEETVAAFDETELQGSVTLGTPDDYADRFLPEMLARFARSNPRVEVSVVCEPSITLMEMARTGDIDLAIVTDCGEMPTEVIRQEPLFWVGSSSTAPSARRSCRSRSISRPASGATLRWRGSPRSAAATASSIPAAIRGHRRRGACRLGGHRRRQVGAATGHARSRRG